jgi:hypothetical protein
MNCLIYIVNFLRLLSLLLIALESGSDYFRWVSCAHMNEFILKPGIPATVLSRTASVSPYLPSPIDDTSSIRTLGAKDGLLPIRPCSNSFLWANHVYLSGQVGPRSRHHICQDRLWHFTKCEAADHRANGQRRWHVYVHLFILLFGSAYLRNIGFKQSSPRNFSWVD